MTWQHTNRPHLSGIVPLQILIAGRHCTAGAVRVIPFSNLGTSVIRINQVDDHIEDSADGRRLPYRYYPTLLEKTGS